MGMGKEFKEFAMKGNVVDLAIGVIIGGAFGKIVSSLVDDIITPAVLTPALKAANLADLSKLVIPGTAIKYGNFISTLLSFIIIAFVRIWSCTWLCSEPDSNKAYEQEI